MVETEIPHITICIPVYRNVIFLKRLLDSISIQTYTNYEVIVTDDSPDDSVHDFILNYKSINRLRYFHNVPALGTPENWNESIRRAAGKWIKIMHHDDWFADAEALQGFYEASQKYQDNAFIFSAFTNVNNYKNAGKTQKTIRCSCVDLFLLRLNVLHLFKKVYIGNPSCTLVRRDVNILYDNRFKFVVDFEYYIRCLKAVKKWHYIDVPLLNIGIHEEQVTQFTFLVPEVQIPENHILIEEYGTSILQNVFVYDYYWRMYRNLGIRGIDDVKKIYNHPIPQPLSKMIVFQQAIPLRILKNGLISKLLMTFNYLVYRLIAK